jgi:hypothetical protein
MPLARFGRGSHCFAFYGPSHRVEGLCSKILTRLGCCIHKSQLRGSCRVRQLDEKLAVVLTMPSVRLPRWREARMRQAVSFAFLPCNQLTIPPTLPDHTASETNMEQSQSLLLTKVPPELRVMIWDYASDAATLHFECVDSRLECVWCGDTDDSTKLGFRHACWKAHRFISRAGSRSVAIDSPAAQGQGRGRLALLLACKTLYVQDTSLGCGCARKKSEIDEKCI